MQGLDPLKSNHSHDLRLLHDVNIIVNLNNRMKNVTPQVPQIKLTYKNEYSTPQDITGNGMTGDIKSVSDFNLYLRQHIMRHPKTLERNEQKYAGWIHAATMDIYDDGRKFEFTSIDSDAEEKASLASKEVEKGIDTSICPGNGFAERQTDLKQYVNMNNRISKLNGGRKKNKSNKKRVYKRNVHIDKYLLHSS